MARTTLTDRVGLLEQQSDSLENDFEELEHLLLDFMEERDRQIDETKEREAKLQSQVAELSSKIAGLEEKARMLEKLSDRGWQVWIALFGAGLALLISLLKH